MALIEPGPRSVGVATLLQEVADALQARLGAVAVHGELSGFTRAASGHCYFTLKDGSGQAAVLRCAMFRRAAALLDFHPQDGQQVLLRGRVTVYEARGELQCVVEAMQRLGQGALYELFLRQKARLEAAGLFDPARKRPLPAWPQTLAVVSSLAAAALQDVLTALARRAPQVRVVVVPSAVQGAEAPAQLVRALARANALPEVDTIVLCRGGGSLEDLWAFNDEQVVRAVAASAKPVVCGVGHETDLTLADLAADLRAPTPTAAAELAAPRRDEALAQLQARAQALQRASQRLLDRHAQRLDLLALRRSRLAALLQRQAQRLVHLQQRAQAALGAQLRLHAQHLQALGQRLQALDPRQVLARGYAWVTHPGGRPVTAAAHLQPGAALQAEWHDGRATLVVQQVQLQDPGA